MAKHKHGGDIYSMPCQIDFSANINPLGVPEGVKAAVVESIGQIQHYPDVECRELTRQLALKEGVRESDILFGNGAAELIYGLVMGLRPQRAVLAVPGFAEYEEALMAGGCEIVYYSRNDSYDLTEEYLAELTDETDLIFLCNPNNPTGNLTPRPLLEKILAVCQEKDILMVVDECFLGFREDAGDYSMKSWLASSQHLFILNALTKLYAMPGLRLGYGLCRNAAVRERIKQVRQPWSVSVPAQLAGVAALAEGGYISRSRAAISREREFLEGRLKELSLEVYPGTVNYIFFKGPAALAVKCRERGCLIRDCSNYRGLQPGCFRIAVKTREENQTLLAVIGEVIKESEKWQK